MANPHRAAGGAGEGDCLHRFYKFHDRGHKHGAGGTDEADERGGLGVLGDVFVWGDGKVKRDDEKVFVV